MDKNAKVLQTNVLLTETTNFLKFVFIFLTTFWRGGFFIISMPPFELIHRPDYFISSFIPYSPTFSDRTDSSEVFEKPPPWRVTSWSEQVFSGANDSTGHHTLCVSNQIWIPQTEKETKQKQETKRTDWNREQWWIIATRFRCSDGASAEYDIMFSNTRKARPTYSETQQNQKNR